MSKIIEDTKLDFKDVCVIPRITSINSRKDVDLIASYESLHAKQFITGIPIITANMSAVSTFNMARAMAKHDMFCALHKHYSVEEYVKFYDRNSTEYSAINEHVFYTLGIHDLPKFESVIDKLGYIPKLINCDVANGYMKSFHDFIKKVRSIAPLSIIMAGNVVTPEGCIALVEAGTDIVKIGIGSSAACRSRVVAGVGIPQLSTILDCYETVYNIGALMCSDGGCNEPGDFVKAFGAGANFVMAGTMFSGHDECDLPVVDGKMDFYGMSSDYAMKIHNGGMNEYRSSEGIHTKVPYKGPVENTVRHILGGLRSAGSYTNSKSIMDFERNITFVKVNRTYNNILEK